jgi:hypothetical protein
MCTQSFRIPDRHPEHPDNILLVLDEYANDEILDGSIFSSTKTSDSRSMNTSSDSSSNEDEEMLVDECHIAF